MDAYSVSTTLALNDQLSPGLRRLQALLRASDKDLEAFRKKLLALKLPKLAIVTNAGAVTKDINLLQRRLVAAHNAGQRLGRTLTALPSSLPALGGLNAVTRAIQLATRNAQALATTLNGARLPPPPRTPRAPGPAGAGGGGAGNHGGGILTPGARHSIHDVATIGRGVGAVFQPGFDFSHESYNLTAKGVSAADLSRVQAAAFKAQAGARSTDAAGNMHLANELYALNGGDIDTLVAQLPWAAQVDSYLSNLVGEHSHKQTTSTFRDIAKAGELLGMRPGKGAGPGGMTFEQWIGEATKAIAASGGLLKGRDLTQMVSQAGAAGMSTDPMELLQHLPEMAINQGGSKVGTMMMSLFQKGTGMMTLKSFNSLSRAGLIDPSKVEMDHGHISDFKPGALKNEDQFFKHPLEWIHSTWWGAANARNMRERGHDFSDAHEVSLAFARDFQARNAVRFGEELYFQHGAMMNFEEMQKRAKGLDLDGQLAQDGSAALGAVTASWRTFLTALTESANPIVVPFLNGLSGALSKLASWMTEHKEIAGITTSAATVGAGVAGGGLVVGGLTGFFTGGGAIAGAGSGAAAGLVVGAPLGALTGGGLLAAAAEKRFGFGQSDNMGLAPPTLGNSSDALRPGDDATWSTFFRQLKDVIGEAFTGATVQMDSRKVGEIIADGMARAGVVPSTSGQPDTRMFPTPYGD